MQYLAYRQTKEHTHTYTGNYTITSTLWQDEKANMVRATQGCQVHFPGNTHTHARTHAYTHARAHTHRQVCKQTRHSIIWLFPCVQQKKTVYVVAVTKEGWWRNGPIAAWYHDTDPGLNKWDRKIDDLRTLLVDRQGSHSHDGFLINHLFQRCQRWMIVGVEEEWREMIRKQVRKLEKQKKIIVY